MIIKEKNTNKKLNATALTLGAMITPAIANSATSVFADEKAPTEVVNEETKQPGKEETGKDTQTTQPGQTNPDGEKGPEGSQKPGNTEGTKPDEGKQDGQQNEQNKETLVWTIVVKGTDGKQIKSDKVTFTSTDKKDVYEAKDEAGVLNGQVTLIDGKLDLNILFEEDDEIKKSFQDWVFKENGEKKYQLPGLKEGESSKQMGVVDMEAKTLTFTVEPITNNSTDEKEPGIGDNTGETEKPGTPEEGTGETKPEGTPSTPDGSTDEKEPGIDEGTGGTEGEKPSTGAGDEEKPIEKPDTNKPEQKPSDNKDENKKPEQKPSNNKTESKKDKNGLTVKDYEEAKKKLEVIQNKYKDDKEGPGKWIHDMTQSIIKKLDTNIGNIKDGFDATFDKKSFEDDIKELTRFPNTELGKKMNETQKKSISETKQILTDLLNGKLTTTTTKNDKLPNGSSSVKDNGGVTSNKTTISNDQVPEGSVTTTENIGGSDLVSTAETRGNSALSGIAVAAVAISTIGSAVLLKRHA